MNLCSKNILILLLIFAIASIVNGVIVFQNPPNFGTTQVQLTTTTGFISTSTSNTFTFANPGYQNISSLGLALCGYDIPTPTALQFRAQASFDNTANSIVVLILPLNTTRLAFINYYIIIVTQQVQSFLFLQNICLNPPYSPFNISMFNRPQNYSLFSPFVINSTSKVTAIPFIRSVNNIVADTFNFLQIQSIVPSGTTGFTITLFNNHSFQSEVCLSIIYYWDTQGLRLNLQNVSYSSNFLLINSSSSTQNLASVSQQNFTLNNMYGPIFNRKCLVGFQSFRMLASTRQTVSFNLTGNGIYGIISSSNYIMNYAWFCMAVITCQGSLSQYYPAINDCQAPCTINNCTICQTSTSCSSCNSGFFLNPIFRCTACMLNCINCTNATVCNQCANGFFYNSTACAPCAQFCTNCLNGACRSCQPGYYPNGFQCVFCASVLPNCLQCATGTACSVCPQGFYSSGTASGCILCSSVLVGCSRCALALICSTCQAGFYLVGSTCRTCIPSISSCCSFFISNCSLCRNTTSCNLCAIGYYLVNNNQSCAACSNTLTNCISCSTPTACLLCNTTFFLNPYNQCVSCSSSISQCSTCANSTYCLFCQLPFLMVNGSCFNCPIWPTNNLYFLDQNNVCQPCSQITPNCIRCDGMTCTQCSDLWFLDSKTNTCNLCADFISNCLSCISPTVCSICRNGYYPDLNNSSICTKCQDKVARCNTCSQALDSNKNTYSLICMGCRNEYYLNSSICSPCIQSINFCLTCSNNFQCVECQTGYFLSSTMTCIPCNELIIGCSSCQSSSTCLSCIAGYYLINSYCTECRMAINFCFSCGRINNTLTCSACLTGYYLGANFTCFQCNSTLQFCSSCSNSTTCRSCISGYTVNFNFTCSPCSYLIPFCQHCTTTCIKCIDNYLLDNFGQCQSCNYYINGCSLCEYVANNITLKDDLNCTTCMTGYLIYLSGNLAKCVACNITITNCISCLNLTYCNTCNNLSFINSKNTCSLCSLFLPNCIYCNGSSTCLVCAASYYLNDNQACQYCDASQFGNDGSPLRLNLCLNCKYMAGVATCLQCVVGYYVSANRCTSCSVIPNCLNCASSSLCIQCQNGYYLSASNTQCLNCPATLTYCASCDLNGICLKCDSDCYLNTTLNICIKCFQITAGCNSCTDNGTCLTCTDGYYMSGLSCMSCAAIFKDCLLCNNNTECTLYSSNYTVSSSDNMILTMFPSKTWMYVSFGSFGGLLLMIVICCIWRRFRAKEEKVEEKQVSQATKSHTERQLNHLEMQNNDVKIDHGNLCQHCKNNKFDVMHIELLCSHCQRKPKSKNNHIIRKQVVKKVQNKDGNSYGRPRMMKQSQSKSKKSSDDNQLVFSQSSKGKQSDKNEKVSLQARMKHTQSEQISQKQRKLSEVGEKKPKLAKRTSRSHL